MAMKIAKTGFTTSRPISCMAGGTCPVTLRPPGWLSESVKSPAMQATIHQSTMPEPVTAIIAPIARLAPR